MPKYLLPCSACNKTITISPTQAGEEIVCTHCAKPNSIPSLREIKSLPVADGADAKPAAAWAMEQGVTFAVGVSLAFIATVVIAVSAYYWQKLETTDTSGAEIAQLGKFIDDFEPVQAYNWWRMLKDRGMGDPEKPEFVKARENASRLETQMMIAGGVALLGLIIAGSAFLLRPAPRRPQKKAA